MLDLIFFSYRQAYDEKSISKIVFSKNYFRLYYYFENASLNFIILQS